MPTGSSARSPRYSAKASLRKIKSTLVRSIRRAQKYDLLGRNVAELVDLPQGQPGHPSRAMTEGQASLVLKAAAGQLAAFVIVVRVGQGKDAATHAATETGELACGTWTRQRASATEIGTDLAATTCRFCRANLGLDADADENRRFEALFVLSITLGLRPRENCASSPGTTSISTTPSSTSGAQRAAPVMSRHPSRSARRLCHPEGRRQQLRAGSRGGGGAGPYNRAAANPPRWGDYSFAVPDGTSDSAWLATEYIPPKSSQTTTGIRNWGTRVIEVPLG